MILVIPLSPRCHAVFSPFPFAPCRHSVLAPFSLRRLVIFAIDVDGGDGRWLVSDFQAVFAPPGAVHVYVVVSLLPSRHGMLVSQTSIALEQLADGQSVQVAEDVSFAPRHHRVVAPLPLSVVDDVIVARQDGVAQSRQEST